MKGDAPHELAYEPAKMNTIYFVEWPEKCPDLLVMTHLRVSINHGTNEAERNIQVSSKL